jgi:hypothetical protein
MDENHGRPPRRLPTEDDELKPDISGRGLSPEEALRRERDTYGDDSAFPNREDIEDEHRGAE